MTTARLLPLLAVATALAVLAACEMIEPAKPQPRAARTTASNLDVPRIMRGTIASETQVMGYRPTIVRGYGLVVGLNGTGSQDIPPALRAHMLAEMALKGIGKESTGWGHLKPEQMLASPDTAVVIVEGVIPPGASGRQVLGRSRIDGTKFDVRVYAHNSTSTTSLDGGRLYTAALRPVQPGELLPPVGSRQAAPMAEARGPIFVNPFAEPGAIGRDTVNRNSGRIMDGGEALKDVPIKLRLNTASHARAEIIQSAVNTRFPQEPGQRDPTARGQSSEMIRINVPLSYRHRPDVFVELLKHTTIRQSGAEAVANSVVSLVQSEPALAASASWRWQALGPRALPAIARLYDHPEERPRLAALRAGALLDDALVIPHLIDMTESASPDVRRQAVALLGEMRLDPRIDLALRQRQDDESVDVRLAAYEAQLKRNDPFIIHYDVDGKFVVDIVESSKPMVYITQVGQPRIVIFGADTRLEPPLLVDAWSGRFMLKAEQDDEQVEVYYRPSDGYGRIIQRTDPRLADFVAFLGHQTTVEQPEPGLGLSYGETVGALYQIWRQAEPGFAFKAEQDRVLAAINRQRTNLDYADRPEFGDPDYDFLLPVEEGGTDDAAGAAGALAPLEALPGMAEPK